LGLVLLQPSTKQRFIHAAAPQSRYVPRQVFSLAPPPTQIAQVALKVLDLDRLPPKSLKLLTQETQLMSLSKHPNVLRVSWLFSPKAMPFIRMNPFQVRGSWIKGHKLYIALRLMRKGSVADIMKYSFPDGVEEETIRCILKQALEGLK
jgi:serine/threonine-protein kinase OSR1/STK39